MKRKKRAYFGGSFNPPHFGHLAIAGAALEAGRADVVMLAPAFAPPHKEGSSIAPYADRVAMTRLLSEGRRGIEVSEIEGELRLEPSYTCQVMRELARRYPEDELLLLIGGDSLSSLHDWKNGRALARDYGIIAYPRAGYAFDPSIWDGATAEKLRKSLLTGKFLEISSTFVREKLENHENTANIIPGNVEQYIREKHLYGC